MTSRSTLTARLPNFFLVGAMKAGTTAVAEALEAHPAIHLSPIKEPNFFCTDLYDFGLGNDGPSLRALLPRVYAGERIHHAYIRNEHLYRQLFDCECDSPILGECSTTYLYSRSAAECIARVCPDAKILIILRNPIERAFSEYLMNRSIGVARGSFAECLDREAEERSVGRIPVHHRYITAGLYGEQVQRYLDVFPQENVCVRFFEELSSDPDGFLAAIIEFLEIDSSPRLRLPRSNSATFPRFPVLNELLHQTGLKAAIRAALPRRVKETLKLRYYGRPPADLSLSRADRLRLVDAFCDDVERLSQIVGRDLRGWLRE